MKREQARAHAIELLDKARKSERSSQAYPALTPDAERHFEEYWGTPMPEDLRDLLRLWNGGSAELEYSWASLKGFPVDGHPPSGGDIERINYFVYPEYQPWPTTHVPFATDGCGDDYVLVPAPNGHGKWVAFIDHEIGTSNPDEIHYYVASSLWHFLIGELEIRRIGPQAVRINAYPWVEFPDGSQWPFNQELALEFDPELAAYDSPLSPWNT